MNLSIKLGLLFILLSFGILNAQFNVDVNPREITVGDHIEVMLQVRIPDGSKAMMPTSNSFSPAEVLQIDTLRKTPNELQLKYTISLFKPGRTDLPSVPVVLSKPDGSLDSTMIALGPITVRSVLANDTTFELRDIQPPKSLKWTFSDILPYLIGFVIALILGLLAWYLWRKQKGKVKPEVVYIPPQPAPHVVALKRLQELENQKLWQNGFIKEYYSELSEILREYIENRYSFNALEMTTEEILQVQSKWAADNDQLVEVRRVLTCADLVKFAKFKPDTVENERCLRSSFDYVNKTKQVETGYVPEGQAKAIESKV